MNTELDPRICEAANDLIREVSGREEIGTDVPALTLWSFLKLLADLPDADLRIQLNALVESLGYDAYHALVESLGQGRPASMETQR
jgi:hypothetical protein